MSPTVMLSKCPSGFASCEVVGCALPNTCGKYLQVFKGKCDHKYNNCGHLSSPKKYTFKQKYTKEKPQFTKGSFTFKDVKNTITVNFHRKKHAYKFVCCLNGKWMGFTEAPLTSERYMSVSKILYYGKLIIKNSKL
jgi:hypothetical protein